MKTSYTDQSYRKKINPGLLILALAILITAMPLQAGYHLHDYTETRVHNQKIEERLAEWIHRARQHRAILLESDHPKIVQWREQISSIEFTDQITGLQRLNAVVNSDVIYVDDYSHYHLKDYWALPDQTLEEGGDCEDIALLKAASLFLVGWPEHKMHLLVGFLTERGTPESHAVLLVETDDGHQHILRSITDEVVTPDLFAFTPIYAVDKQGTLVVKPAAR